MKQRIQIKKDCVADIFNLPCVEGVKKTGKDRILVVMVKVRTAKGVPYTHYAFEGEWLVQDDKGIWYVEKNG